MKNILIVGPGRHGKTSLAKKINEELNYFVINLDKLMTVFGKAYPQLDVRIAWDYHKATANVAPFLGHFLGIFSSDHGFADDLNLQTHDVNGNKFVLEGGHFDLDEISSILKTYGIDELKEKFILIGLVQNKKTAAEFFDNIRKHDTEEEWTYSFDDNDLMKLCNALVSHSEKMYSHLVNYGFTIYDTTTERKRVFEKIVEDIKSKLGYGAEPH